jgi:HD superfamily phosphohydrolase
MNKMQSKINEILTTINSKMDLSLLEIKLTNIFDSDKIESQVDNINKIFEQIESSVEISEEYILKEVSNKLNIPLIEILKISHENIKELKQEIREKKENESVDVIVKAFKESFTLCLKDIDTEIDWLDMLCKFMIISGN